MGLAKDDCGELMDRTVGSTVIVPRPGLEVKGAAGRDSSEEYAWSDSARQPAPGQGWPAVGAPGGGSPGVASSGA